MSTTESEPTSGVILGRSFADQWQSTDLHGLPFWTGEFGGSGPDWEVYLSEDDEDGIPYPDGIRVDPVVNRALSSESAEALALVLSTAAVRARERRG